MAIIDNIIDVTVSATLPAIPVASLQTILIVGAAGTGSGTAESVARYGSLVEVAGAGFKSGDPVYDAASIAFANGARNIVIAVKGSGDDIADDVLPRAEQFGGWTGIALAGSYSSDYTDVATYADANGKIFGVTATTTTNPLASTYKNAFACYTASSSTNALNVYMHVALMARCFQEVAGGVTWAFKSLSGIAVDELSASTISTLDTAKLNYYIRVGGRNITLNGVTVGGEYIDVIYAAMVLKHDIQEAVFNALASNGKLPFSNAGIGVIYGAIASVLSRAQSNGVVAADEYDENGELVKGFDIQVPNALNVSETDKAARILRDVEFSATLAGAIHKVVIHGSLKA